VRLNSSNNLQIVPLGFPIVSMAQPERNVVVRYLSSFSPQFRKATMDDDFLESWSWIEDEESERLARQDYIDLMIAQEEQNDRRTTTGNN
jgi:hypothetical protein